MASQYIRYPSNTGGGVSSINSLTGAVTLAAGTGITLVPAGNTITINATGGGDVVGPASATDNAVARFDGTTGKLIQNSIVTISDSGNVIASSYGSSGGTIANSGQVRLASGDAINWRDSTASFNLGISLSSDIFQIGAPINVVGSIRSNTSLILEETGAGTDIITIQAPASIASSYTLTLPVDDGASSQFLQTDGSGVLSWQNIPSINLASGVTGVLPIANGGTGSSTQNFVDLTTTQSIAGDKTFTGNTTSKNLTINGTGGNGFITYLTQSSAPSTPASGFSLFANSTNAFSWKGANGFLRIFDGTSNTADRAYTLPDASGTVALINSSAALLSGSQFITSGTTYTTPSTINTNTRFKFTLIGGGGGGGGSNSGATSSGGGGGGAVVVFTSGLSPSTGYTITIGGGGAGGIDITTAPTAGGSTTLNTGTVYTAGGGGAGTNSSTSIGGAGGTATNGTINIPGQQGVGAGPTTSDTGGGGSSGLLWGSGAAGIRASGPGNPGTGFGGGGGGANGLSQNGGAGTAGCILVEWNN